MIKIKIIKIFNYLNPSNIIVNASKAKPNASNLCGKFGGDTNKIADIIKNTNEKTKRIKLTICIDFN